MIGPYIAGYVASHLAEDVYEEWSRHDDAMNAYDDTDESDEPDGDDWVEWEGP